MSIFNSYNMQTSFKKNIQGHPLEFSRILSPLRYNIVNKDLDKLGMVVRMQKDDKGMWNAETTKNLPFWFNEITLDIHNAIAENEADINYRMIEL